MSDRRNPGPVSRAARTTLDGSTVGTETSRRAKPTRTVPGLTVLAHPDSGRIGDRSPLSLAGRASSVAISRIEPDFFPQNGDTSAPLGDRHLSRTPILSIDRQEDLVISPASRRLTFEGQLLVEPRQVSNQELCRGVVLVLANRVALLLHPMTVPLPEPLSDFDMVGISRALIEVQHDINRVRDLKVPVLLLGETGTGKELVARGIHDRGARSAGPFVAVNMAALPPSVAAAELFGTLKGAYTGADRSRRGLVQEATGGTLFLDEVGAMPSEVQVLLLRFLEDQQARPLGATQAELVDVRVVAATDSDLDLAVEDGRFSRALLQRFGGYEIRLPPLRERKDDIGLLLHHFLAMELAELERSERLIDPGMGRLPWLPAALWPLLVNYSWPGNVRELRNLARRIAIRYHDGEVDIEEIGRTLSGSEEPGEAIESLRVSRRAPNKSYRSPSEVSDEELEMALRAHAWEIPQAAAQLGVSRPSMYNLIDRHPTLRKASDLGREELERELGRGSRGLSELASRLEVSRTALKSRLRELQLNGPGQRPTESS